jgi:tetratricopeptide (TPR) repeat protein
MRLTLFLRQANLGQDSIDHLLREVRSAPDDFSIRIRLSAALFTSGRYEDALSEAKNAIRLLSEMPPGSPAAPDSDGLAVAHLLAGHSLEGLGKTSEARIEWTRASALDRHAVGRAARAALRKHPELNGGGK